MKRLRAWWRRVGRWYAVGAASAFDLFSSGPKRARSVKAALDEDLRKIEGDLARARKWLEDHPSPLPPTPEDHIREAHNAEMAELEQEIRDRRYGFH